MMFSIDEAQMLVVVAVFILLLTVVFLAIFEKAFKTSVIIIKSVENNFEKHIRKDLFGNIDD